MVVGRARSRESGPSGEFVEQRLAGTLIFAAFLLLAGSTLHAFAKLRGVDAEV